MLSCRKAFGQLLKVTRQAQINQSCRPLKYVGIINVDKLWYGHSSDDKKTQRELDTKIKLKEGISQSKYVNSKERPACERQPYAHCPPSCVEECGGRPPCDPSKKDDQFPNWKHILATLIIAGVTISVMHYNGLFGNNNESKLEKKDVEKKRRRPREVTKNPVTSKFIPSEVPYLLIGGGTAAFSAFRSIKSRDPKAKVLVITEEEDFPYMRPPLSKELWYNTDRATSAKLNFKQWNGTQRSLFYEPREFYANVTDLMQSDKGGVAVARGWKVTKLDVMNRIATLDDGYEISYDKCLIATGASPKIHPVLASAPNEVKDKVITFRTKEDFLELEENVHDPQCKNIVVIGGGFLGSELACSLAQNLDKDKKVYQVYKEKYIMAQILPEYLSEWTTKKAELEGVNCIPNVEIEGFTYKKEKLSLILTGNKILDADQVIVAIGVEPNTQLAEPSRLEIEPNIGGFLVNAELEARSNLWVAGDASCFYDIRLGRRRVEHHDHAVISGRLAGENMTGAGKPYLHQSMFWSDLGPEVGYEAIGIIDSSLPTVGIFAKPTQAEEKLEEVNQTVNKSSDNNIEKKLTLTQKDQATQDPDNKNVSSKTKLIQEEKLVNYDKGVIFYLRDDIVVGIVLWNIFNRMSIARQVLARGTKYEELNEVAKLFTVHDD